MPRVIESRVIALAFAFAAAASVAAPAEPFKIAPAAPAGAADTPAFQTTPVRYAPRRAQFRRRLLRIPGVRRHRCAAADAPAYAPMEPDADARRRRVDPRYDRQVVDYAGPEKPGTVIINTPERLLYLVESGGRAVALTESASAVGFTWAGVKFVSMNGNAGLAAAGRNAPAPARSAPFHVRRSRESARRAGPLSRFLAVFASMAPMSPGPSAPRCLRAASACATRNVIDLYGRVPVGAKVLVI